MANIDIVPGLLDITQPMATSNSIDFIFRDKFNNVIDLTDATVLFTVKAAEWDSDATDSSAKVKKELSITDGPNGKANLFITHEESFLPVREYYHDIKIILRVDGYPPFVSTALTGAYIITADSTNRVVGVA